MGARFAEPLSIFFAVQLIIPGTRAAVAEAKRA